MQHLFRLRTILLVVMLSVLALPAGGVYVFRIFENELVRQTEQELIAQAATLAATWRNLLSTNEKHPPENLLLTPIFSRLNLSVSIAPPRPEAQQTAIKPDSAMLLPSRVFTNIMAEAQQITLSGMRLLNPQGIVLAGRDEVGLSLAHVPEVSQAMNGTYASVIRKRISDEPRPSIYSISRGTDIRVFVALPVLDDDKLLGIIYLSRTPTSILERLFSVRHEVVLAAGAMLLLTILLGLLVSSTIARPIRELLRQIERLRTGEVRTVTPISNPVSQEVALLSTSFAAMSETLAERSEYIRRFAAHVSHEFKTPLTSMQGALELLLDHADSMDTEQGRHFLHNLLADTQRMKLLVSRLLELARAESMEPKNRTSSLPEVLKPLQSALRDRGLSLHCTDTGTRLPIAPDALEIVLGNLCENSIQHGADYMDMTVRMLDDVLRLTLTDNGRGISEANRDKIFTPFFTTKRGSGGTGLGLEICRTVLKAYDARISLDPDGPGATFHLDFPA